ncbi:tRNA-binding protein [Saccharopolyspora sp. HNM0983]|uniref:tRNA-binding protein n=1 Tax=Saccharopolyspora montiporae TaxID=2781240 RepID=A0A929FYP1_9PSEU|nr:tRNA-binding protein [Saccharopolyspora sp. HNM0983]
MGTIEWSDFDRVELRVGTVLSAEPNAAARKPSYVLTVDLGAGDVRTSSAQLTQHYRPEDLVGRQVLCVCNFAPKRVAGVKSEVLVTGVHDADGAVVLPTFEHPVPDGSRLA